MKILYITSPIEDYLADSLFHGLRSDFGQDCVDFPKCEILYRSNASKSPELYGKGFTLYSGLLEDIPIDRFHIEPKVKAGFFDLIVFSSIANQFGVFVQLREWLAGNNTIIVDGDDSARPYPAAGRFWRNPRYWFLPRAHREFLYFKREWTPQTRFNVCGAILPEHITRLIPSAQNLRQIAFSIPAEKIAVACAPKKREFATHIVDAEVARSIPGARTEHVFEHEHDYYLDLQESRFGVTIKRSGWDCLRHYEIAANGAVPCFRNLHRKPTTCAPHKLSASNSLSYSCASDLFKKVEKISDSEYADLRSGALAWVARQTTTARAREVIDEFIRFTCTV